MKLIGFFLTIAFSLLAQQNTSLTLHSYAAITDLNAYAKPSLPQSGPGSPGFGPAGTLYTDPVFGSHIVRITDAHSVPQGNGFYTTSAAYLNAWSSDDRAFMLVSDQGATGIFDFDPLLLRAKFHAWATVGYPIFSYRFPHLLYGSAGQTIASWDYTTGRSTTILDLTQVKPFSGYIGPVTISGDDSVLAVAFGGQQDTYPYVVVYNRATSGMHLLDLSASTVDGIPTNVSFAPGVHSMQMDMSGHYLEVAVQNIGTFVWNLDTLLFTQVPFNPAGSGHSTLGFGMKFNQSGFLTNTGTSDSRGFTLRPLSDPADPAAMHQVITNPPSAPFSWTEDGHWAWANAKPGQSIPVCGSFYSQAPFTPWETWFDEIVCVATDGSGTVWRIAHHRSTFNGNFWSEPRGNVSQDGRFFIFTSNWDQTLDPTGQRLDVFLVDLASAGAKKVPSLLPLR